jgi:hypothetical protein
MSEGVVHEAPEPALPQALTFSGAKVVVIEADHETARGARDGIDVARITLRHRDAPCAGVCRPRLAVNNLAGP